MKTLNIVIINKEAIFSRRDGDIVCVNSDYQIRFAFDSEWAGYTTKTARFIWNGKHKDVSFTGDTCAVPVVSNTERLEVGVYVDGLSTTTSAQIPCRRSILCGTTTESGEGEGGEAVIQPLNVTANGTYTPSAGVDGYAPVVVNVPTGGGITPSGTLDINENGTYDVARYEYVAVDVPTEGGGSCIIKAGVYHFVDIPDITHTAIYPNSYGLRFQTSDGEEHGYIYGEPAEGCLCFSGVAAFSHYEGDTWRPGYQIVTVHEDTEVSADFAAWWGETTIPAERLGNIKPENIKAGVSIFGVVGTYSAGGGGGGGEGDATLAAGRYYLSGEIFFPDQPWTEQPISCTVAVERGEEIGGEWFGDTVEYECSKMELEYFESGLYNLKLDTSSGTEHLSGGEIVNVSVYIDEDQSVSAEFLAWFNEYFPEMP